jgi:DNA-binding CsgD family transcriptional regulator
MSRRGRPPHPDILTPRQWEVLDLLRQDYSDQQIADDLNLTLSGAKYHVSEILTKLNLPSREEAAAWQAPLPAERPSLWRKAFALSLALKVAAAAIVLTAATGITLLALGSASNGTGDSSTSSSPLVFPVLGLPEPPQQPQLSREVALTKAASAIYYSLQTVGSSLAAVDVQPTSLHGALRNYHGIIALPGYEPEPTVWLVRARLVAGQYVESWPSGETPPPPRSGLQRWQRRGLRRHIR